MSAAPPSVAGLLADLQALWVALAPTPAERAAWARHRAEIAATARQRLAARIEALRAAVADTADLIDTIREELADCTPADRPGLTREFNAATAKLVGLHREIADMTRAHRATARAC